MRRQRPEYDPAKTFIFIIFGAAFVIAADLFLFDGYKIIWPEKKPPVVTSFLDIEDLQRRHEKYMKDGILPARSNFQPSQALTRSLMEEELKPFMPIEPFETKSAENELPQSKPEELALGLDLIEPEKESEIIMPDENLLQNVEPASGVEEDLLDGSFDEPKQEVAQEQKIDLLGEEKPEIPAAQEEAVTSEVPAPAIKGSGKIAIIIDDMGLSLRGRQLEIMQYPLTLAYLPYAENLQERTAIAKQNGHELMVHMPMEPINGNDGGPRVLEVSDSPEEFVETIKWGLSQFEGYVGVNNHMGSRLTQDKAAMQTVMHALKEKGLYFVDSKTIGSSVAAEVAAQNGLDYAERDVFLDHVITREFVDNALQSLENIARHKGYAIAIGHPHKETVEALKEWLPTLEAKGLTLVPVSALVKHQNVPDVAQQNHNIALEAGEYNNIEPSAPNDILTQYSYAPASPTE